MKSLTTLKQKAVQKVLDFHHNRKGLETLQVVLIIAVAAIILALIVNQWPDIRDWAEEAISAITDFSTDG